MNGLCLTIKYGEYVLINDSKIYIEKHTGTACKLRIQAPEGTQIKRQGWENRMEKMSHTAFMKLSEQEKEFIIRNIKSKMEFYISLGKLVTEAQGLTSNDLKISGRVVVDVTSSMKYSNRKAWLKR